MIRLARAVLVDAMRDAGLLGMPERFTSPVNAARASIPYHREGLPVVDLNLVEPATGRPMEYFFVVAAPGHPDYPSRDPRQCIVGWYGVDMFTGQRNDALRFGSSYMPYSKTMVDYMCARRAFDCLINQVRGYLGTNKMAGK